MQESFSHRREFWQSFRKCFKFGFIVGVAYVLFSPRREKSTKRAPPRAFALWKPVCAFMYLFDRGYTRHRFETFAPQIPAETNISKRRQTQPKVDARRALPPAFYLRRNTRPPCVKHRTCRRIAWGALCRMGLWSLLGNRSPSVRPRPVPQSGRAQRGGRRSDDTSGSWQTAT